METKQERNARTSRCELCRDGYTPIGMFGVDPYQRPNAPHAYYVDGTRQVWDASLEEEVR